MSRRKVGTRLAELRARGIQPVTQEQLALLTGEDVTTVSRDETGDRAMSRERAIKYARVFGIPTHELFLQLPEGQPSGK